MHTVHTKQLTLQPVQQQRIERKLSRLSEHLGMLYDIDASVIRAEISRQSHARMHSERYLCTLTIHLPERVVLRASKRALSLEAAFDLASHKIEGQIRKMRTKRNSRLGRDSHKFVFAG